MASLQTAILGAGCFWCVEACYLQLKGVQSVLPGYAGGHVHNPSYKEVCTGTTGHAEVVKVDYDPDLISFEQLLEIFFKLHDPTSLNRQGEDVGTQYRSAIFYTTETQQQIAHQVIQALNVSGAYSKPIVTEVTPYTNFFPAEEYHHNYFARNPYQGYCRAVVGPKVEKFQKVFKELLNS